MQILKILIAFHLVLVISRFNLTFCVSLSMTKSNRRPLHPHQPHSPHRLALVTSGFGEPILHLVNFFQEKANSDPEITLPPTRLKDAKLKSLNFIIKLLYFYLAFLCYCCRLQRNLRLGRANFLAKYFK
jgi:hypothetical protein